MANLREESLKNVLALRLGRYDGIHVAPERSDAGEEVDIAIVSRRGSGLRRDSY